MQANRSPSYLSSLLFLLCNTDMLPLSCCYLLTSLQYKSSLSAPMATWNRHYRSENCFQLFGLDICCLDPTLLQAVPSIQSHHSRLRPEYCIYGHSGPSQPLGPPETVTPGPKKCTSSLAWVYAIPFKPCSKL